MIFFKQGIPSSWYTSDKIFTLEKEKVFEKEWIYIANELEIPKPGDYVAQSFLGKPIVTVRTKQGQIKTYLNICKHRGAPLVQRETGNLSQMRFLCQYHSWMFDLEGKFLGAPSCPSVDMLSEQAHLIQLEPISTEIYNHLIFISFDKEPESLVRSKNEFVQFLETFSLDWSKYQFKKRIKRTGNFNWKTWVDGFQECYHCPTIHPLFNRDFFLQSYQVQNQTQFSSHSCQRKKPSETGANQGNWIWLWPNLGLPCYGPCIYTLSVMPINSQQTELVYSFFTDPNMSEQAFLEFSNFVEIITNEDINICERVQKNYASGCFEKAFLHPERENGVIHFHSLLMKTLVYPEYYELPTQPVLSAQNPSYQAGTSTL